MVRLTQVHREFRPAVRRSINEGWAVYLDGAGHLAFRGPDGQRTTIASTPKGGRSRSVSNYLAELRRAGVPA